MGYCVDYDKMNDILAVWSETYHVYAPAWDKRKKKVRYREIKTVDQIVLDRQADFSPKEAVLSGVTDDVLFYRYGSDGE